VGKVTFNSNSDEALNDDLKKKSKATEALGNDFLFKVIKR
jgi:hypothetical protein